MLKKENQLSRKEIELLPKVELHVHLDCCLSFAVVSRLKPGITREKYNKDFIGRKILPGTNLWRWIG